MSLRKPLPVKPFTIKHENTFSLQKIVLDSWVGTGLSAEPCDYIVFHQENSHKHVILYSQCIKCICACCIKKNSV